MIDWKSFDKISLLNIEDDSFNQELAAAIFEELPNLTVFKADNGTEAIKIIENNDIDVILLDLIMPEMNGFATLEFLKKNHKFNKIPVIVVTAEESEKKATYKLGANDFISKPYNPEELKLRVFNHLRLKRFSALLENIKEDLIYTNEVSINHLDDLKSALAMADNFQKQLLEKLANLAYENGYKDKLSSVRVGEYAKLLAKYYGLNSKDIENIYFSMIIYDIGLLKVPKEKLENDNNNEFKQHPLFALEILNDIEETSLIKMAKIIALNHHENWDGSGYPNKIKNDEIPLVARIASIVDYFDELTSYRIYAKDIYNANEALEIIKRENGVKFDPDILNLFVNNFNAFVEIKNKFS